MTVPVIAAVAFAILAAVLAAAVMVQRRRMQRLADASETAHQREGGGNGARAMLAAMREPALLHGDRIEAVNAAFAELVGIPAQQLVGRAISELVSKEYGELAALAVGRALASQNGPALAEVELSDSHGQVTRLELSGSPLDSGGRRLVLFTAAEMLPHRESAVSAPARSQLALDSLGEDMLTPSPLWRRPAHGSDTDDRSDVFQYALPTSSCSRMRSARA
jgi:PAS domain S-box-containing protein